MAWRRFLGFVAACLLLLASGGGVEAQDGDALRFFQQNPSRSLFRTGPPPRRFDFERVEPRSSQTGRRKSATDTDLADRPSMPPTIFVHVIGDALAEALGQGLKEQLAETKPEVGVMRKVRAASGLVRENHFDWPKALRELLAGPDKVDMLVMMLGSNDRQPLRDEAGSHEFGSDRWRDIYVKRIDEMLAIAQEKRVPMLVVGMPVMQTQQFSADMLAINALFRERAPRAGAVYVDIWEAFATEKGEYASTGPDVNGVIVRLRTGDGVLFTKPGARKLGFFVGKEVAEQLGRERPAEIAALPTDLSEQIRREQPGMTPQSMIAAVPLPELPELPSIGQRPLTGPVIALTSPPLGPGGALVRGRFVLPATEMGILVEQAFVYGRSPPPKPGRADDFSWPRPEGPRARSDAAAPGQPFSAAARSRP